MTAQERPSAEKRKVVRVRNHEGLCPKSVGMAQHCPPCTEKRGLVLQGNPTAPRAPLKKAAYEVCVVMRVHNDLVDTLRKQTMQPYRKKRDTTNRREAFRKVLRKGPQP